MRILVRATNWIGDAVMSLPAVRALRTRYPQAYIAVLAKPWVADLYRAETSIDHVISLEGAPGWRDLAAKWRTVRALRRERFDLAVLLPNSFESAALVYLGGIPARVGYARDARHLLLTQAPKIPAPGETPRHEKYYYLELLRRAEILSTLPDVSEILLEGTPAARQRGLALFASHGLTAPVIGVSPGAAYGTAKRWLPERFAEAARDLAAHTGSAVAVFGSSAEHALCAQVAEASAGRNFAGATSLRDFIDMTAACHVYLTNDSGAMHIAAALDVPTATVFGPTDETATGPSGLHSRLVREPVECAPCKLRECPIDHRCMTRVSSHHVVAEALVALAAGQ